MDVCDGGSYGDSDVCEVIWEELESLIGCAVRCGSVCSCSGC